jgi:tetratricopeptide (TPR) repeat protein
VQTGAGGRNSQDRNDAKLASAEKDLLAAVTIYPKFATAWSDLGRARLMHQETDGAREAFLKAIEADSKLVEPYVGLGEQSMREKDWKGAAQYIGKALQLDPVDYPALWFEDAIANYNLQNWDRAEKDARQAVMLPPGKSDPHANELLGLILLNKRDYSGAKDALNTFLKSSPKPEEAARVRQQLDEIDRQLANNIH